MARERTDIHRPSTIQPKDYTFVGIWTGNWQYSFDANATGVMIRERTWVKKHMDNSKGQWASHDHGGTCMICGAHAIYRAVFYHPATNEYIQTGMDCAEKMNMGDVQRFRVLRDAITAAQKARTGYKKAEGILTENGMAEVWDTFARLTRDRDTLEGTLQKAGLQGDELARATLRDLWLDEDRDPDAQPVAWGKEEKILVDIVGKLVQYGRLSGRQFDFLNKLIQDIANRPQVLEQKRTREQQWAEEKAKAPDVPVGRGTFTFTVLKVDVKHNQFGVRHVMTIKADAGWTAWGSIPSHMVGNVEKGTRVEITAQFERSEQDSKFGFFSRPSGRVVD